jgi:aminoglycoside-2''-adenylyltransferase
MSAQIFELPSKVAAIMRDFKPCWVVAGGWAIDLYLGRVTRPHADIEIAILRRDQTALHDYLKAWRWQKVVDGVFSDWSRAERLTLPVHELYCFNETAEPQQLEVLLNEADGADWVFRRDERVRLALSRCHLTGPRA